MTKIKAVAYTCNNCGKEQIVRADEEHALIGIRMVVTVTMPTYGDQWEPFLCNWDCAIEYMTKQRDGQGDRS